MSDPRSVPMFVNGQAMRGGSLNDALASAVFIGATQTAPSYRFLSVRDEFPALQIVESGGASIAGELYEIDLADLRERLLPREPAELELGVIKLLDGSSSFSMRLRDGLAADFHDITHIASWRTYLCGLPGS